MFHHLFRVLQYSHAILDPMEYSCNINSQAYNVARNVFELFYSPGQS